MEEIEILDIEPKNKPFSVIETYGDDLTRRNYITNPAIARESEIKKLILTLLTPEKSALLIGKPGIGKTAIVEGLAYAINKKDVPDILKDYRVVKLNSSALTTKIKLENREEMVLTLLVEELKVLKKTIIFIDEIHTLIGENVSLDLANMLKPALDRGEVKAIGATTTIEYDRYIIKDRAFLRRFERIDVEEPDAKTTARILVESLPRIEKQTGIKFGYNTYVANQIMESIVSATSEYKRVYGLSAMYPDIAFSVLTQAFSHALFSNKEKVDIEDVYEAIKYSKRIYPDSIIKELALFKEKFKAICAEEHILLKEVKIEDIQTKSDTPY
jgi:ATP-dependent Clp protease ATP-binding subunit ClpC